MWSSTHSRDVGDYFKCDSAARDGAALRHSPQQALCETLPHTCTTTSTHLLISEHVKVFCSYPSCLAATHLSPGDVDADAFPEDKLHVGRVAQLNHDAHGQVDPLVT